MAIRPFVVFGWEHLLGLTVSLGCGGALVWAARRSGSRRFDWGVRIGLAVGCLASEAYLILFWSWTGTGLRYVLPLHMCDMSILIAPVALLTGNRLCYELLFFWGFGGAMQGLLTPDVDWGFPSIRCVCCFEYHALIITSALYATLVMRQRPTKMSIVRAGLAALILGVLMIPVNWALGSNYMFVMHKPETASLLDVMGPWPWYLAVLAVAAFLILCLCYLPYLLLDRRAAARGRHAEAARGQR